MYIPEYLKKIGLLLAQKHERAYLVGGFVRNELLGLPVTDIDLAGTAGVYQVAQILNDRPEYKVIMRAPAFGTVEIHALDGGNRHICEYTAFRSDSYKGGLHKPSSVTFTRDIALDAFRRDFTVNALYADLVDGQVIDLAGGLADLQAHLLRAVKPDANAVFAEDGLRLLRLIRFAAQLDWSIDEKTYHAAKANVSLLADISKERVLNELNMILLADTFYPLPSRRTIYFALALLRDSGALRYILPDIILTDKALSLCAGAGPILPVRYAALLSDYPADTARELLGGRGLKAPQKLIDESASLLRHFKDETDALDAMHKVIALGRERTGHLLELKRAANKETAPLSSALGKLTDEGLLDGVGALAVNGNDCLSFGITGKDIQRALNQILDMVLTGALPNDRAALLAYLEGRRT